MKGPDDCAFCGMKGPDDCGGMKGPDDCGMTFCAALAMSAAGLRPVGCPPMRRPPNCCGASHFCTSGGPSGPGGSSMRCIGRVCRWNCSAAAPAKGAISGGPSGPGCCGRIRPICRAMPGTASIMPRATGPPSGPPPGCGGLIMRPIACPSPGTMPPPVWSCVGRGRDWNARPSRASRPRPSPFAPPSGGRPTGPVFVPGAGGRRRKPCIRSISGESIIGFCISSPPRDAQPRLPSHSRAPESHSQHSRRPGTSLRRS